MKVTAFQIFATILLIFAYLVTMRIQPEAQEDDMAGVIPHSILLYFEQKDGADALKRFSASRLGERLLSIDFLAVAQEIGVQDDSIGLMKRILDTCRTAQDDPVFEKIVGRRIALALMLPVESQPTTNLMEFLRHNAVMVAKPENLRQWVDTGENPSEKAGGFPVLSTSQYGTHRIFRVLLGEQSYSLVILKGLAVMSQNEKHVRHCIDTVDGELPALTTDLDFQEIRKEFAKPESFIYLPMKTMRHFVSTKGKSFDFPAKDLLMKGLQSTSGFNGFGYVAWRKKERVDKKILIRFERQEMNSFAAHYVETPPVASPMLSLATRNPMLYYWSNTLNFGSVSMYLEDAAQHDPRLAEFLARLQKTTGKDASSTFALLGREASMIVEEGPQDTLFPFPLAIFFIRIEKMAEFRNVIDNLLQSYELPFKEEEYRSAWFRHWSKGPQDGLLPLYGFWQNYFFFGNSTPLLRRVIDTQGSRNSLADVPSVRKIDPGLSARNNSVSYLNNVQLISMVEDFLEVLGTFIAIEDRETAMKIRIVLKKIVNPLLDGAAMYKASATRSHIAGNLLTIDSVTDISTPNSARD